MIGIWVGQDAAGGRGKRSPVRFSLPPMSVKTLREYFWRICTEFQTAFKTPPCHMVGSCQNIFCRTISSAGMWGRLQRFRRLHVAVDILSSSTRTTNELSDPTRQVVECHFHRGRVVSKYCMSGTGIGHIRELSIVLRQVTPELEGKGKQHD